MNRLNKTIFKRPFAKVANVGNLTKVLFPHWTRLLIWSMTLSRVPFMKLCSRLISLWNVNGASFLVQYTKECSRIVQHFLADTPIHRSDGVPVGITKGLPTIIPGELRTQLRGRVPSVCRGVLSIFAVYRIIQVPAKPKLSTITDPFKGLSPTISRFEINKVLAELGFLDSMRFPPIRLKLSGSAGPNSRRAVMGLWKDLAAWRNNPILFGKLKEFLSFLKGGSELSSLMDAEMALLPPFEGNQHYLGRLSLKEEAAGKVRVFAIADLFTQTALEPLHRSLFELLDKLPQDGTFNQVAPLDILISNIRKGKYEGSNIYSYDLSAATDRLPVDLQVQILESLSGSQSFSLLWGSLMRDRDWILIDRTKEGEQAVPYRYAVGQPMGALSSWAMLALTHHVIVRIAAHRVGELNFQDYAVLGDDIVICSDSVAKSYHWLMTEWLGVDINLSKSLISKHSFEFAKRLVCFDGEFTPVGPKNLLLGLKSINGIPSIFLDLFNKNFTMDESMVDQIMVNPPFLRKSQASSLLYLIKGPFGFIPTAGGVASSMKNVTALTTVRIASLLESIEYARFILELQEWESVVKQSANNMLLLELTRGVPLTKDTDAPMYDVQSGYMFLVLKSRLSVDFQRLIASKPKRRFLFNGPLITFDYGRPTYGYEIVTYIRTILHQTEVLFVRPFDLYKEEMVVLPFKSATHSMNHFIKLVKERELDKERSRYEEDE
jgi:hypothetical protein